MKIQCRTGIHIQCTLKSTRMFKQYHLLAQKVLPILECIWKRMATKKRKHIKKYLAI